MSEEQQQKDQFVNPIDPDKITDNPHSLEYAHTVGGAIVRPEDMGKVKGRAVSAMQEQTGLQMNQIYEQMQLLAKQAREIRDRVDISQRIYGAEMRFEPIISHIYYLYRKGDKDILTMVSPNEWRRKIPYDSFIAKVKLLGDHTWEILEKGEEL